MTLVETNGRPSTSPSAGKGRRAISGAMGGLQASAARLAVLKVEARIDVLPSEV